MKALFTLILPVLMLCRTVSAQDTLYFYKSGQVVMQNAVSNIDSITFKKGNTVNPQDSSLVVDVEGNVYHTDTVGTQIWLKENLKVSQYRNGDVIGTTNPATLDIYDQNAPKYQWAYAGNESNVAVYGRLYTWYAVTDTRGICPAGWHVPTDAEWKTFTDYLINNGYGYLGSDKLGKSLASTSGWAPDPVSGNTGNDQASNNKSGFSGLPSGDRYFGGIFEGLKTTQAWWTFDVDEYNHSQLTQWLQYNYPFLVRFDLNYPINAFSVRCLKDK